MSQQPRPDLSNAVPFKLDGVYCRLIALTRGQYAIVDEEDYNDLARFLWFAHYNKKGRCFYAYRNAKIGAKRIFVQMHREILGLRHGDKREGDHKEPAATTDNRRNNLRITGREGSTRNIRVQKNSKCGLKGVCKRKIGTKWTAQIQVDGKRKNLGNFATKEEAAEAYKQAAIKHYGEFARF